jgi:hypothetical protein
MDSSGDEDDPSSFDDPSSAGNVPQIGGNSEWTFEVEIPGTSVATATLNGMTVAAR